MQHSSTSTENIVAGRLANGKSKKAHERPFAANQGAMMK